MKKIALMSLLAMFAVSVSANAGVFDTDFRPGTGKFVSEYGAAYITGRTQDRSARTDIGAGETSQLALNMAYGLNSKFAITVGVGNNNNISPIGGNRFASPEVGFDWRAFSGDGFGLDIKAAYGMAWTRANNTPAPYDARIGDNNFSIGGYLFGKAEKLQWGAGAELEYVFDRTVVGGDFYNYNFVFDVLYYIDVTSALSAQLGYDVLNASESVQLYDRYLNIGYIYNISKTASMQPFVGYHFQSANSANSATLNDNFWMLGAKFAVQF